MPLVKHLCGLLEGRANGSELDVRVDDLRVGAVLLNVLGLTRVDRAGTASDTGRGRVGIGGVSLGVEPQHVDGVVVPEGHDENVAASKRGRRSGRRSA
jgi:hypothetical protein